ncbi:hypothetical protein [Cupriavidus sp. SZY C1]|uniref:hypothetical protein n=1 Tax=Cupriavidus sp. SZY C1 TaxID=3055037 RepID=UPI00391D8F7A
MGKVATENNYLNHTQKRDRAEAMAACADKACRDKVRAEYAAVWEKNKREVTDCSTQSKCLTLARDLRLEQQAQGERMAELQVKRAWQLVRRREGRVRRSTVWRCQPKSIANRRYRQCK